MSATAVRDAAEYESRLQKYYFERAEEARAVRVGEKEVSEQAAIVARYRDLFTRPQIEALREAEAAASGEDDERLYRLRKTCEAGVISAEIAEQEDALENAILGARVTFHGEAMPSARCAGEARSPRLVRRPRGARRARAGCIGGVQPRPAHAARGARAARSRRQRRARPDRAQRGGEGDLPARARGCAHCCIRCDDGRVGQAPRHLVREAARPRARRAALECARPLPAAVVTARVDVYEGRCGRHLPRDDACARLRHDRDPEHPPRSRGSPAEESACVRYPVESA